MSPEVVFEAGTAIRQFSVLGDVLVHRAIHVTERDPFWQQALLFDDIQNLESPSGGRIRTVTL